MTPIQGYKDIQAQGAGFDALPAGGYKCVIVNAQEKDSRTGRPMLCLCLDIAEGEYAGHFRKLWETRKANEKDGKKAKWPCIFYMLADNEAMPRFKGNMNAIEASNEGYDWDATGWKEKTLTNKVTGAVFREEEFEKSDGSVGVSVRVAWLCSYDKAEGAKVPARRKLKQSIAATGGVPETTEEIPF